jgi:quinol monooxygenase YgiN
MIHVLATLKVKEGHLAEFVAIFKANVPNVLQEKGCVEYTPALDIPTDIATQDSDANVVTVIEKWETLEDLNTHAVAPHMRAYGEQVKDMLEKVSLKILGNA